MKIAIVCSPTTGGSGIIATELGRNMAQRGHEIHFISYEKPVLLDDSLKNIYFHKVYVTDYPFFKYPPYDMSLIIRTADLLKKYDFDIIHVHYALPYGLCAHFARILIKNPKVKIITTIHGTEVFVLGQNELYRTMLKNVVETSDSITTVSQYLQQATYDLVGREIDIAILYNFVDTELFSPEKKNIQLRKQYAKEHEKIIIHASNMRPIKRLLDVICVFNHIQQKLPARLLLLGEGPDKSKAQDLCLQLGIQDKVYFLGNQFNRADFLSISDLLMLPSSFESFGLSALEAMSCGVPVIMTCMGGAKELIGEEKNSLMCKPSDIDGMTKQAIDLLSHPQKLQEMKMNARKRVLTHFSSSLSIDLYEQYYQSVLQKK